MKREEKKVSSCLLTPESIRMADPAGPVLLCGLCPNRSDMVGNLAEKCVVAKSR